MKFKTIFIILFLSFITKIGLATNPITLTLESERNIVLIKKSAKKTFFQNVKSKLIKSYKTFTSKIILRAIGFNDAKSILKLCLITGISALSCYLFSVFLILIGFIFPKVALLTPILALMGYMLSIIALILLLFWVYLKYAV